MAKAPKRTTKPDSKPLQSPPDDWMPLTAAFLHIQQVVGGEELAEEDLRLRLESGDVEAQNRLVTPGEGIDIIPLAPELFTGPDPILFGIYEVGQNKFLRGYDLLRHHGHNILLRRADVCRVWPMRLAEPASPTDERPSKQLPPTGPKGIGRKTWVVVSEVWALWRQDYRWPKQEDLLHNVNERLGHNKWASLSTLKIALAYLIKEGFIDL
jgi:hypothetical protein